MCTQTPLRRAADYAFHVKWSRGRNAKTYALAIGYLCRWFEEEGITHLDEITKPVLLALFDDLRERGNKETTIAWKRAVLTGITAEAFEADPPLSSRRALPRVEIRKETTPKWWLTPETKDVLVDYLEERATPASLLLADYVEFVCLTGLRVEEALRLKRSDFRDLGTDRPVMFVPGTKTRSAAASLPLSGAAAAIVRRRLGADGAVLFATNYEALAHAWNTYAKPVVDPNGEHPTATLKALRRTFGWYATKNKMPTAILQKFYRHAHIATTVGYLNLIGSTDVETLREYLV